MELLERANILHSIRHSPGHGIPIGVDIDFDTFKVIYLDVGLYPFRLNGTLKDCIESSLKSNKKSGLILIQY